MRFGICGCGDHSVKNAPDIEARPSNVRFAPESGHHETLKGCLLCAKADSCTAAKSVLFDHVVGFGEQCRWHCQSERLRCLQINHEIEFARLHDRQVGGFSPFEDAADIGSGVLVALGDIGPIAD
jgi:hypothetical protein